MERKDFSQYLPGSLKNYSKEGYDAAVEKVMQNGKTKLL
jgi:hypothetical protein